MLKETLLKDDFSRIRAATVPSACGASACRGIDFIANDICLLPRVYSGLINLNHRQILEQVDNFSPSENTDVITVSMTIFADGK